MNNHTQELSKAEILALLDKSIALSSLDEAQGLFARHAQPGATLAVPASLRKAAAKGQIKWFNRFLGPDVSFSEFEILADSNGASPLRGFVRREWDADKVKSEQYYFLSRNGAADAVPEEVEVSVPVKRVIQKVRPVEVVVEEFVDVRVEKIVQKIRPVEVIVEQFVDVPVEKIVERVRPVENLVERLVDVHYDRIIERINPIENLVERQVDVVYDKVVERLNPVEHIIEQKVDVVYDRIVQRLNPIENLVEQVVDVRYNRIVERLNPIENLGERFRPAESLPNRCGVDPYNLRLIKGIDAKIEQLFHAKDVWTLADLARCQPEWIREVLAEAGPQFALYDPTDWPRLAQHAACNGN